MEINVKENNSSLINSKDFEKEEQSDSFDDDFVFSSNGSVEGDQKKQS